MAGCREVLAERIAAKGAISFREFMETALYDPANGYYAAHAAIGEGGDFVTAPTISPLFARAVARSFVGDASKLEGPIVFLEAAASCGEFVGDFRRALAEIDPAVSRRTRIWALERSARGRKGLAKTGAVERIFSDVSQIPENSISGWVFSNELYDALPVHRVEMRDGKLVELGVTLSPPLPAGGGRGEGDSPTPGVPSPAATPRPLPWGEAAREGSASAPCRFAWTSWPAPRELSDYLTHFGVELAEGQIAEINLEAGPLHRALCRSIRKGRIVSFDYGHRAPVLYHPHARRGGTLAVHSRGRRGGDPLENPGLVDMTAHVNWDDLIEAGEAEGFASEEVRRLSRFLIESGLFEDAERDRYSALRLFDPEGIGEALAVLVQSKNVEARRVLVPGEGPPIVSS